MKFKDKLTSKVGRQILITKKHSPVLLFGVGTVGVVATVVLACRATLKMEEILAEAEKNKVEISDAEALETNDYTSEDAQKDSVNNRIQTAAKIVKLYAPAFGVGVISIGALTGSHVILSRRNIALTAAYAALDKGFKDYRGRVVDELGHGKDDEFFYGTTEKQVSVQTDDGPKVQTVKIPNKGTNVYTFLFARETSRNWSEQNNYNQMFLRSQQNYANDMLNARGHVFLNEILDMLGLARTKAGSVTGWVKGSNGDNHVDFGFMRDLVAAKDFINGDESSVWLEFNVDGVIYDLI